MLGTEARAAQVRVSLELTVQEGLWVSSVFREQLNTAGRDRVHGEALGSCAKPAIGGFPEKVTLE